MFYVSLVCLSICQEDCWKHTGLDFMKLGGRANTKAFHIFNRYHGRLHTSLFNFVDNVYGFLSRIALSESLFSVSRQSFVNDIQEYLKLEVEWDLRLISVTKQ